MSDSPHVTELDALIGSLLDRTITPAQMATLAERIRTDESAADRVAELMLLANDTSELLNASGQKQRSDKATERRREPIARSALRVPRFAYILAAALLLLAAAVAIYTVVFDPESSADPDRSAPVAVLLDTEGVAWVSEPLSVGASVERRAIEIGGGTLRLATTSGAELTLEGPASMTLVSGGRVSLDRGRLYARVEGGGFVVDTPRFTVTDLGTEFAVGVGGATGDAMVAVYEGRVRIDGHGAAAELGAGDGWQLAADGTVRSAAANELLVRPTDTDLASARYASAVRADRPRVYWRFEADLDRAVINSAGAGFAVKLNGGSALADGVLGRALRLSDALGRDAAACDAVIGLMVGDQYSVELWMKAGGEQDGALFSLGDAIYIGLIPTGVRGAKGPTLRYLHRPLNRYDGSVDLYAPIEPTSWHHVAAVKTADRMTLYLDGKAAATREQAAPLDNGQAPAFALGRLSTKPIGSGDTRAFTGLIDETAIYDYPLTAEQVARHYAAAGVHPSKREQP